MEQLIEIIKLISEKYINNITVVLDKKSLTLQILNNRKILYEVLYIEEFEGKLRVKSLFGGIDKITDSKGLEEIIVTLENYISNNVEGIKNMIKDLKKEIEEMINSNTSKLIALCGKACTGKTTMAIKLSEYISYDLNNSVIFFSLETDETTIRNKIKNDSNNLYIDDTSGISINEICKKVKKLKTEKDIKFIIIDYLELVGYDKSKCLSRNREIENICKELKKLVIELNIPILFTSYLSCRGNNLIEDKEKLKEIDEKIFLEDNQTLYC